MSSASEFRINCTPEEWAAYKRGMHDGSNIRTTDRTPPRDTISDAIRDELTGRDHELPHHLIEALAENIEAALRSEELLKDDA